MLEPTIDLKVLATEQRDPALADLDLLSLEERCALQNRLDRDVPEAVALALPQIAASVRSVVKAISGGGRLIYVGAGTSGRLGVLDASECPPTFGTEPTLVQGVIAGGQIALTSAVEGAEDDAEAGAAAMDGRRISAFDCVVGITASGRTPYVLAALMRAKTLGAATIGVTNNAPSEIAVIADTTIAAVVGPELIAGSTRLKAGTAQKLVLNMLTTQAMIEIGKTYGNAMVDVSATNAKLKVRALMLVQEITGASEEVAQSALAHAGGSVKLAIVMLLRGMDAEAARALLAAHGGRLRAATLRSD